MSNQQTNPIIPWSNVYGLARTLLALGTMITLGLSSPYDIFQPLGSGLHGLADQAFPAKYGLFFLFEPHQINLARWIAVAVLAVAASGWRPRFTAPFHWYVTASLSTSAIVLDGGDQVSSVLTFLILPIALTDGRKWHWSRAQAKAVQGHRGAVAGLVALSALWILRLQAAVIYFNAGIAKMFVEDWNNGTALYYWTVHPVFGAPDYLRPVLTILQNPMAVTAITWGVMLFEVVLACALFMRKRYWAPFLLAGIAFHIGIAMLHGLISFGLAMAAMLLLFLRPVENEFRLAPPTFSLEGLRSRLGFSQRTPLPDAAFQETAWPETP